MNNQAIKKDNGKPQVNLVPLDVLIPFARVREFAVNKYGINGIEAWREIGEERLFAALLRHSMEYQKNPDAIDKESGLPHAYHMMVNAGFISILAHERQKVLMDDNK